MRQTIPTNDEIGDPVVATRQVSVATMDVPSPGSTKKKFVLPKPHTDDMVSNCRVEPDSLSRFHLLAVHSACIPLLRPDKENAKKKKMLTDSAPSWAEPLDSDGSHNDA